MNIDRDFDHPTGGYLELEGPGSAGPDTPSLWPVWLDGLSERQLCQPGTELIQQGASLRQVYVLEAGIVKLTHVDQSGTEMILSLRFPGWFLGVSAVIAQRPSPVSVTTVSRCSLRRIPVGAFRDLLDSDLSLSSHIHQLQAKEVIDQQTYLAQLGTLSSRERLERVLRELISVLHSQPSKAGIRLQLPINGRELARLVAITPEHLSRLLRQMENDGVIRRDRGWLIVCDLDRLSSTPGAERAARCTCTFCSNIAHFGAARSQAG